MTKFIAIASGKGGVGKTSTAINLGTALSQMGRHVVVMDANLTTPNVGIHLGVSKVPVSLNDVLRGKKSISDAAYEHSSGLKIIPASISMEELAHINYDKLTDAVLDLDGKTELVLIDVAAGLGKEAISAIKSADEILVVVTPDMPSVTDALKTIKLAHDVGIKTAGVIINRVRDDGLELSAKNVEALLERPIVGIIPEDDNMRKALKQKHPIVFSHPESKASLGYKKVAALMVGAKYEHSASKKQESFFNSLLKKLGLA